MRTQSMTVEFSKEVLKMNNTIEHQEQVIDELTLKAAKYKAYFYGKYDLAEKIDAQMEENTNNLIGEFDGFCYASWRAKAEYRTLRDMFVEDLITEEEYNFCEGR